MLDGFKKIYISSLTNAVEEIYVATSRSQINSHSYQCDMRQQHNTQQAGTFYSSSLNSWAYVKRRNIDSHLLKLIHTSLPVEEFIEIYRSLCNGLRGSSALQVISCYWLSQYFVTDVHKSTYETSIKLRPIKQLLGSN